MHKYKQTRIGNRQLTINVPRFVFSLTMGFLIIVILPLSIHKILLAYGVDEPKIQSNPSINTPVVKPEPQPIDPPKSQVTDTTNDYKTIFKNDLFIGDSITNGLAFYGYIDKRNTFTTLGATLVKTTNNLDQISINNPERIYLLFGPNDIDPTKKDERFYNNYAALIQAIKSRSPQTKIYVQSILPVNSDVVAQRPHLSPQHITALNTQLQSICKTEGVYYLDLASVISDTNQDLYEPDGIHFHRNFYPLWLNYLIERSR